MQDPKSNPTEATEMFLKNLCICGPFNFAIPTVCAINGHAFGAGFMLALTHDVRIMREDRGFLCANEMQLGLSIPRPELSLFKHKIPANAFYETVQLSKNGLELMRLVLGLFKQQARLAKLPELALKKAEELAPLATGEKNFGYQKKCYSVKMQ